MAITRKGYRQLDLFRQEDPDESQPWGGRSPRHLTDAYQRFSLGSEAATLEESDEDIRLDEQDRRFHYGY